MFVGCSKEDEEEKAVEVSHKTVAAVWEVKDVLLDGQWISADAARFGHEITLTEDGLCLSTLSGSYIEYYDIDGNTVRCVDEKGKIFFMLRFSEINSVEATAHLTVVSGNKEYDVRLKRDESHPNRYLEPESYLPGKWKIVYPEEGTMIFSSYSVEITYGDFYLKEPYSRWRNTLTSIGVGVGDWPKYEISGVDLVSKPNVLYFSNSTGTYPKISFRAERQ